MKNGATKIAISFSFFVIVILFNGCVRFYRTTDVRNSVNDTERKLNETISSMESYQQDYQSGYDYLVNNRRKEDEPFPQKLSLMQSMSAVVDKLKMEQPVAAGIKKDFESLVSGFPPGQNIQSNKSGWEEFKPIYARYSVLLDALNTMIDEANDIQSELRDPAREHGIGKSNADGLKKQITALINDFDRAAAARGESGAMVKQKQAEIKTLYEEITAEIGDRSEIWMMPGSYVQVRYEAIKNKTDEANKIISSIKK